ncbi:FHA domain-containing protein [Paraglaciecola arctica]|uniref:FHA domain-containing protein n=1 Tax=Paraglaciecola arctica TaxID=1128911 RepID=UPI001C076AD2|nr:FHA domain-containing protein [Paraglaciecola arctica]MBU3005244.1 FHA domain-containing protein [Paraglaciecola arctica]
MAIVLELLSRKNIPLKHYKFEQDYVCVGRDFNNDLRLDDPYICPSHMLVAIDPESGKLIVNDCQSTNGIKVNNKFVRQATLNSHDVIKIGRTRLRIIDTKVPLVEAIPLSELEENLNWLNQSFLAVFLSFVCLSFLLLSKYLGSVQEFNLIKALPSELGQLAAFCIWPLCFAILAKVVKKESHVVSQFNLTFLVILLANALLLIQKIAIFNIHPGSWFTWLELTIFALVVGGFIWLSLFIAFHQTTRRRNIITGSMTFIILAPIYALGFLNSDEFNTRPSYNPVLLPPAYNMTSSVTTDKFIEDVNDLFTQVDKLKAK